VQSLAERAVRAPNQRSEPIYRPPTPVELSDTLKDTTQLRVAVGPPDALLYVWISQPDTRPENITFSFTRTHSDAHIVRKPATKPTTAPGRLPLGTVFLLCGIGEREELGPYILYKEMLVTEGFRVVQVDLRGHGRSTGDWITYGVVESKDLVQVLDELEKRRLVDGPVGAMGISYGASVAIEWAGIDPRVKAVVALEPFATFSDAAHDAAPLVLGNWRWLFSDRDIDRAIETAGQLARFDPRAASPLAAITKTKAPVLLIHSRADELVSFHQSERLHAAAPDHSWLIAVKGQSHFWMWLQSIDLIHGASQWWFNHYLAGKPTTRPFMDMKIDHAFHG
jgi:alpha-beta hydrolase superfamily lysophospholipase